MGKIFEYVVLIGNLSLIFGLQHHKDVLPSGTYHGEKQPNYTPPGLKHNFPNVGNDSVNRRGKDDPSPPSFNAKRTEQQQQHINLNKGSNSFTPGLSAYLLDPPVTNIKRNFFVSTNGYRNPRPNRETPWRNFPPPASQELISGKNHKKNFPNHFFEKNNSLRQKNLRSTLNNVKNNSFAHQNVLAQGSQNQNSYRRYQQGERYPRFYHSSQASQACDPCNSVPWMPVLNVPNYYRKERNQKFEVNKPGPNNFHYDYHALSSDSHDFVLPSSPLVPPTPAALDGTISSSFGLPVGNIPTGHGLLAPITHFVSKFNDYGGQNSDYSNSLTYFTPQTLLDSSPIPELSPVPIVPIYDSNQFYSGQLYDSSDIGLVPPTANPLSVSNVVFTIAEGSSTNVDSYNHLNLNSNKVHTSSFTNFKKNTQVNSHAISQDHKKPSIPIQGLEGIDIVKSIPLAEFSTSSSESHQTVGSGHYNAPNAVFTNVHQEQTVLQSNPSSYLIPPEAYFNSSESQLPGFYNGQRQKEFQYQSPVKIQSGVSKPLVDSAPSWLFLDAHTQPKNPHSSSHSLMAESQEFASIVNNKFGPIPLATKQDTENSKSKKIQIIIPYTTKDKNDLDNKIQESVRHEVFRSPQSLTNQTDSRYTPETDVTTALSNLSTGAGDQSPQETNENRELISPDTINFKNDKNNLELNSSKAKKYVTEMQHVLAKNIKELLLREIEKTQNNPNYPLQNNIDNWTALEYSNQKTFGAEEPNKNVTLAHSVTSVPGTSASNVLLPSKKIPDEYFVTIPSPTFDDTLTTLLKVSNISIHSRPFTAKPYSTATAYSPSSINALTTPQTPTTQEKKSDANGDGSNDENNYTVLGSSRVNYWSKLNENSDFSEIKNSTKSYDETTVETSWSSSSAKTEKVQIVTPVPTKRKNSESGSTSRRTTRHVRPTERTIFRKFPTRQNQKPGASGSRKTFFKIANSTKLEKIPTSSTFESEKLAFESKNSTESGKNLTFVASDDKTKTIQEETSVGDKIVSPFLSTLLRNISSDEVDRPVKTDKSEELSINDIIPFRNKELPWESNATDSRQNVGRQRKSLIKQVKLRRPRSPAAHPLWPLLTENSKSGT